MTKSIASEIIPLCLIFGFIMILPPFISTAESHFSILSGILFELKGLIIFIATLSVFFVRDVPSL